MRINIHGSVHMEPYYNDDNPMWKKLKFRNHVMMSREQIPHEGENTLDIIFPDESIVNERNQEVKGLEVIGKDEFGNIRTYWPIKEAEYKAQKQNTKYIFYKNDPFMPFYYYGPDKLDIIKEIAPHSMLDSFKKHLNNVEYVNNDFICNGKKFASHDTNINDTSMYQYLVVNEHYDSEVFKSYMTDSDRKNNKKRGITGMKNENPSFTLKIFIDEFVQSFIERYSKIHPEEEITVRNLSTDFNL